MPDNKLLRFLRAAALLPVLLGALLIASPATHGAEGGASNYLPGLYGDFAVAVTPDPGFYLRNDFYYYMADGKGERFVQSGQLRAGLDLDTFAYLLTGFMVLDKEILGGRYAFGANLPVVYADLSGEIVLGEMTTSFDEDRLAVGDPGLIPVSLFWNFGKFYINLYESIIVPIGSYDKDRLVNAGLNYWSFDTNLSATYLHPEKGHEISACFGYIYNTENDDTDYHTGQEIHLDYMLNQFLSETFALGVHGFYYKQITGDSGGGALLGDFKGEAAGIGPAVMWVTQVKSVALIIGAQWLHEFHAEHRLQGDHLFLNATLDF